MRGRLYELDKVISFDPPPPAFIIDEGKYFIHCGTMHDGIAIYRHRPWGSERTLARAEGWVPDNRFSSGGYYRKGYGDRA